MEKDQIKNYNYGIDILKIIATFMIIIMHVLSQGGIIHSVEYGSIKYYIVWLIESFCYVAVNIYILNSGYLHVSKKINFKSFIKLWLQVFFYTFGFSLAFLIFKPEVVTIKDIIKSCIPILSNQYWYFTQYFILFLSMPYLNIIIEKLDKRQSFKLITIMILSVSLIPTIRGYDLFCIAHGFSSIWLIILYLIGGLIKKHRDEIKISSSKLIASIMILTIITACSKFISDVILKIDYSTTSNLAMIDYTSITVLLTSICFLLLFSNLKINKCKNIIKKISSITFGVYLIHVNYFVWNYLLTNAFSFISNYNLFIFLLMIFIIPLIIFVICAILEYIRQWIFNILKLESCIIKILNNIKISILNIKRKFLKSSGE